MYLIFKYHRLAGFFLCSWQDYDDDDDDDYIIIIIIIIIKSC